MDSRTRKETCLAFLRMAREGRPHEAMERYVTPQARHHNAYFPAGMQALADAMVEAARQQPRASLDVRHVVAEDDLVVVHSHYRPAPEHPGYAVVHLFRFEGDRIAELWDLGQAVPEDLPNADGMF